LKDQIPDEYLDKKRKTSILLNISEIRMSRKTIYFASYELVISFAIGLLMVFIALKILNKYILQIEGDEKHHTKNTAIGIISGAIIVCVLLLVQSSILPSVNTLQLLAINFQEFTVSKFFVTLLYLIIFLVMSILIGLLMLYLSFKIFIVASKDIDEVEEIKSNNVVVSIILSSMLIGMTLFVRPGLERFIGSLIDYERVQKIEPLIRPEDPKDIRTEIK